MEEVIEVKPTQDKISAIQATLAKLSGPARLYQLIGLSAAFVERFGRAGLGTPSGLADLNAAIATLDEAYGYLGPNDPLRGSIAHRLGWLLAMRHLTSPGEGDQNRARAIRLLEEALGSADLPPANVTAARLTLSQLHLMGVWRGLDAINFSAALQGGGVPPECRAEADRAVAYAKQIVDAPMVMEDLSNVAQFTLRAATLARDQIEIMNAGVGGLDQGVLQRVFAGLHEFEAQSAAARRAGSAGGSGMPGQPNLTPQLFDMAMAAMAVESPLDRPAVVIHGSEPAAPTVAPKPRAAAVPADVERLRAALTAQFAQLAATVVESTDVESTDGDRPASDRAVEPPEAYLSAAALLRLDGPLLPVEAVDECVALATTVVHEVEAVDPAGAGVDRFLLAVALLLRARRDTDAGEGYDGWADGAGWGDPVGDGWGDSDAGRWGDGPGGDLAAGLDSLVRAAETIPAEHPAATAALTGLAAFLDDRQPLRSLTDDAARRFADRTAAARAGTESDLAVIRAVGAVCRAAVAVRSGSIDAMAGSTDAMAGSIDGAASSSDATNLGADGTNLGAAVAAVPAGHPWGFRLRAAAGVTAVAVALARQDPAALRSAGAFLAEAVTSAPARYARAPGLRVLSRLAAVLGALGGNDPVVLRAAIDGLAGVSDVKTAGPGEAIRIHALLGGLRLLLDGADDECLASAIESLNLAATQLADDPDAVLRAGSWWRLAEAYRRRGTTADRDQSRLAALRALRGPGQQAAGALMFAGWMLDGGGAHEAFEALEVAALTTSERLDPLVRDVAAVLLGPGVTGGTPTPGPHRPPTVDEVAAALRAIGAAALVHLHPVPGRPHGVGVLLLDASTERLDLLGTVDVPDVAADAPPVGWTDRAWAALVEPLLTLTTTAATAATKVAAGAGPRRVLVAATGALGRLPLPAIRTGAGGYAVDDLVVSFVRSGRQVVELAQRTPLPATDDVVFVANPRGDRDSATFEAMTLRRIFHPRSTGLGRTVEQVHGVGTPADVLAHLPGPAGPGASLLHLGCSLRTAGSPGLELADRAVLDVTRIAAQAGAAPDRDSGGVAILPADVGAHHERWVAFADALLDAGLTGVIGWLWPVPEHIATLMLFVLHGKLVDERLPPAAAVREVHRWMLDPDRVAPPYLPAGQVAALGGTDLTDPRYWAALCHRGR